MPRALTARTAAATALVLLMAVAGGVLWLVLFSGGAGSPVTVSIRSIPAKTEAACHAYLHPLLAKDWPAPSGEAQKERRRHYLRIRESALCADSARSAWYEVDLHLLRREQTIIGCDATLLDGNGNRIPVPPLNEPQHFLILSPTRGIQAGDLWMQPGHDVRIQWKIAPDDTRGIRDFVHPTCETIKPEQVPI